MSEGKLSGRVPDRATYRRSLQTAIRKNSSAFAYSVVITSSLAAISSVEGSPVAGEILLFAVGAVISFTVLDILATEGFRRTLTSEPPEVIAHASSVSFASVGLGIGAAIGSAYLLGAPLAWGIGSFTASTAFILTTAIELSIADLANGDGGEEGGGGEE